MKEKMSILNLTSQEQDSHEIQFRVNMTTAINRHKCAVTDESSLNLVLVLTKASQNTSSRASITTNEQKNSASICLESQTQH